VFINYAYDFNRFTKWSSADGIIKNQDNLKASITMGYHRIEKGLALKNPKPGFGSWFIPGLIKDLDHYQQSFGSDETVQIALNTLNSYYEFNREHDLKQNNIQTSVHELQNNLPPDQERTQQGGILYITKNDILGSSCIDLRSFFESRHSIRQFTSEEVKMNLIEQAVGIARYSPSVCNRQTSKVYMYSRSEKTREVLSYQNGNRGFGDQADKILIVTSDLKSYSSIGERNQCWIDGGMFAMSLIYALHSLGLGTCCLNWSVEKELDQQLKKVTGISDSESILMMIAVGHLPDNLKITQSPRKSVQELLVEKLNE